MARKDLLKNLMEASHQSAESDASEKPRIDTKRPRYSGGAIGAVSQSIAGLKSRSILEIDPARIEAGGIADRLDEDDAGLQALVVSIRDHGQQVPVLLRPHPERKEHYQVVYGRRRVLALRELARPVKALVREMDDRELILAQGQENAARKDLSFIEKANFARQMRDLDYDRPTICAALHVDKTVVSRMLSIIDRVPVELIEAIGAAPSIGRDRWLILADRLKSADRSAGDVIATTRQLHEEVNSDKRFEAVLVALKAPPENPEAVAGEGNSASDPASSSPGFADSPPLPASQDLQDADGNNLGHVRRKPNTVVLTLPVTTPSDTAQDFAEWLITALPEIHHRWKSGDGG